MPEAPSKFDPLLNDDVTDHARCAPASTMTLRDYFAAKAMQSLLAAAARNRNANNDGDILNMSSLYSVISNEAYVLANQMMDARDIP